MKSLVAVAAAFILLLGSAHSAQAAKPEITTITTSGGTYKAEVRGIPADMMKEIAADTGSYRYDYVWMAKGGKAYAANGWLYKGAKAGDPAIASVGLGNANPNQPAMLPDGQYSLRLTIYKITRGVPSYVLNSTQVFQVQSPYLEIGTKAVRDTFLKDSLTSTKPKPVIYGTSSAKHVYIRIYDHAIGKTYHESKKIKVQKGKWKYTVPQKLANGTYNVRLHVTKPSNTLIQAVAEVQLQVKAKTSTTKVKKPANVVSAKEKASDAIEDAEQEISEVRGDVTDDEKGTIARAVLLIADSFLAEAEELFDDGEYEEAEFRAREAEEQAFRAGNYL